MRNQNVHIGALARVANNRFYVRRDRDDNERARGEVLERPYDPLRRHVDAQIRARVP